MTRAVLQRLRFVLLQLGCRLIVLGVRLTRPYLRTPEGDALYRHVAGLIDLRLETGPDDDDAAEAA